MPPRNKKTFKERMEIKYPCALFCLPKTVPSRKIIFFSLIGTGGYQSPIFLPD